jgi:hypothetical protein
MPSLMPSLQLRTEKTPYDLIPPKKAGYRCPLFFISENSSKKACLIIYNVYLFQNLSEQEMDCAKAFK